MISVVIVGTGNVAQNLFNALEKANDVSVKQVIGRNPQKLAFVTDQAITSSNFEKIVAADIYILAISDDAISVVAQNFKNIDGILVHTSGATSINELSTAKTELLRSTKFLFA